MRGPRIVAVILRRRSSGNSRTLFSVFSFMLRLLAIVVCGGAGGLLAWWLVSSLGWTGVAGAIAAALLGMILATLLWAGGIALVNALQRRN
jgi:CHASE2 domain-containing sensor protein